MVENKFSIGIPAYKGKFLKTCIESILNQTYSNWELIIIDDCSPDPIKQIVDGFIDSRIWYYKNELNIGAENVVFNWNKCLEKATGDFFVLMGDDDRMEANYLEEFIKLIKRYPNLDVYHCRSKIIDEIGEAIALTPSWPEYENVFDNIWHRITERRLQYISDFVYRVKPLKNDNGFFFLPLAWGSDDITAYRACGIKGIAHINKPIFNYRSNGLSITSKGSEILKMKAHLQYEQWLKHFLSNSPSTCDEQIVYKDLLSNHRKYLQKRKVNAITKSFNEKIFRRLLYWCKNRKEFGLTYKEIGYALLNNFKRKSATFFYVKSYTVK
jgi:glycosyltransferase involved in cell wall biosynthesis